MGKRSGVVDTTFCPRRAADEFLPLATDLINTVLLSSLILLVTMVKHCLDLLCDCRSSIMSIAFADGRVILVNASHGGVFVL
jgi:hypothetical protein